MEQIQEFFDGTIGAGLVDLLIAVVILFVGFIVARLIAGLTRRLLKRTELDNRLAASLSDPEEGQGFEIEDVLAKIVFWVLMLFVFVAFFDRLGLAGIATPISGFLDRLTTEFLPRIIAGGVLIIIAWLVASALKLMVSKGASLLKIYQRLGK